MTTASEAPVDSQERGKESRELGKAARALVPRSSHGVWAPPVDRRDPLAILTAQDRTRVPELVPIRHGRMVASPFTFYRGAAAIMAADLASAPDSGLRVQLCGDAHLSNFGMFAAPDRRLVFDLNDFDETAVGPFEWDVKRLCASFAVAARSLGFSEADTRRAVRTCARRYRRSMRSFAAMGNLDVWYSRIDVEDMIATPLKGITDAQRARFSANLAKTRSKTSLRAANKLTEVVDGRLQIRNDPPLLVRIENLYEPAESEQFADQIRQLLTQYAKTLQPELRMVLDRFEYVDLAHKVVGVGSVGTRAWIVLLTGRDNGEPLFLQVKEAQASVLEPYAGKVAARNRGQRVVEGQRVMQAASDIFLGWLRTTGIDGKRRDFYVRQLWDQKGSANVEAMEPSALALYGRLCGWTLARAHARSADRVAIASYLGNGPVFEDAITEFSLAYAVQNEEDYAVMAAAVDSGLLPAERDL